MDNKIQCITSFIDIGRGEWSSNYSRSNEKYINNFIEFYSNIEINLILFCEDNFKNEISKRIDSNFKTRINFQTIERENIEYFKMVDAIRDIQNNSSSMMEYKRRDSSNPPEYSNPYYVAMMFAKSEFIKIALDRNLIETSNIAWIDFGIGHGDSSYISAIKNKRLINPDSDKMIFFNRQNIETSTDPFFYSKMLDNVLICGGFYIIPKKLISHFYNEFRKIVDNFIDLHIIDDDQTILSILTASNLDFCNVISSSKYKNNPNAGDWFPVFEFTK
jgi:protein YibB